METHGASSNRALPPVKVILSASADSEDVVIKIADEGGGIPRSGMKRIFSYFYTTGTPAFTDAESVATDFTVDVPMAGLGVGLPLSRVYARYFGGDLQVSPVAFRKPVRVSIVDRHSCSEESDCRHKAITFHRFVNCMLQVISMEGHGTDAYVYLRRLGDAAEPLSEVGSSPALAAAAKTIERHLLPYASSDDVPNALHLSDPSKPHSSFSDPSRVRTARAPLPAVSAASAASPSSGHATASFRVSLKKTKTSPSEPGAAVNGGSASGTGSVSGAKRRFDHRIGNVSAGPA